MAVPKKKTSQSRRDKRRGHDGLSVMHATRSCPQCGALTLQHQVCKDCGFYKGKEVFDVLSDA